MANNATVLIQEPEVTFEELAQSARKLRKQLLQIPVYRAEKALKFMTPRVGIRVAETVGTLDGDMQFGPYDDEREDNSDVKITPRTLYTYLGSVVKNFKPNDIVQSIWGPSVLHGEGMKNTELARMVLTMLTRKMGDHLYQELFKAVRNGKGTTTHDLFNGFDTIAKTEMTAVAGNAEQGIQAKDAAISTALGNMVAIEAITKNNAYDVLRTICKKANEHLMDEEELLLFCPKHVVWDYEEDYKTTTGGTSYNREFNKYVIEGFENVTFVPLSCKKDSPFLQLTTKRNMLYGVDQISDKENVEVARFKAFVLQFIATMFFGVQYESIDKERICFATIDGTAAI
jgi:hypothetical protein